MYLHDLINTRSHGMGEDFANRLIHEPDSIPGMIALVERGDPSLSWRAAWVIDKLAEKDAGLVLPHHPRIVNILKTTTLDGVKRHLLKVLSSGISVACEDGELVTHCLSWIMLPRTPVAVKVNAMQLMVELCHVYPDLKPELRLTIQTGWDTGTAGYKSRAKKILKLL